MKLAILAAVVAIGAASLAMPSQAAPVMPAKAGVTSHAITSVKCVWRTKRVRVARHDGHPAHWVRRRVKVCH